MILKFSTSIFGCCTFNHIWSSSHRYSVGLRFGLEAGRLITLHYSIVSDPLLFLMNQVYPIPPHTLMFGPSETIPIQDITLFSTFPCLLHAYSSSAICCTYAVTFYVKNDEYYVNFVTAKPFEDVPVFVKVLEKVLWQGDDIWCSCQLINDNCISTYWSQSVFQPYAASVPVVNRFIRL